MYRFEGYWDMYTTGNAEPHQALAYGGTVVSIRGGGFDTRTSYKCRFESSPTADSFSTADYLDSEPVPPASSSSFNCVTPNWGHSFVARPTHLTVWRCSNTAPSMTHLSLGSHTDDWPSSSNDDCSQWSNNDRPFSFEASWSSIGPPDGTAVTTDLKDEMWTKMALTANGLDI